MFLKNFSSWLVRWDDLEVQGEETIKAKRGELKIATQVALLHTVNTFLELIKNMIEEI